MPYLGVAGPPVPPSLYIYNPQGKGPNIRICGMCQKVAGGGGVGCGWGGGRLRFSWPLLSRTTASPDPSPCLFAPNLFAAQIYQCRQPFQQPPPRPALPHTTTTTTTTSLWGRTGALWLTSEACAFDSRPAHRPAGSPTPALQSLPWAPQSSCFINTAYNGKQQPEWPLQRPCLLKCDIWSQKDFAVG